MPSLSGKAKGLREIYSGKLRPLESMSRSRNQGEGSGTAGISVSQRAVDRAVWRGMVSRAVADGRRVAETEP